MAKSLPIVEKLSNSGTPPRCNNGYNTWAVSEEIRRTIGRMRWYHRARGILKGKGYSYVDIAKELGVSKSSVGHYMTGEREPSIKQVKHLARLCGVSVSELLGDDALIVSTEIEKQLLETFRATPETDKQTFLKMLSALAADSPPKN